MAKRTKIVCALLLLAAVVPAIYFGPQLFRRSVDYVSREAPPQQSEHWTLQTAHYYEHEVDLETGNMVGWHHPESTTEADVEFSFDAAKPFEFEWSDSVHWFGGCSFQLSSTGSAVFSVGVKEFRDAAGAWTRERCDGFTVTIQLSNVEVRAFAHFLQDAGVDRMPKGYALTGMSDGRQWEMRLAQGAEEKYIRLSNMFPSPARRVAGYIFREIAYPHATEFDSAEVAARLKASAPKVE